MLFDILLHFILDSQILCVSWKRLANLLLDKTLNQKTAQLLTNSLDRLAVEHYALFTSSNLNFHARFIVDNYVAVN